MTIEAWLASPQAQFAPVVWISFMFALTYSIFAFYNWTAQLTKWLSTQCPPHIRWGGATFKLVALWSIFMALNYSLGVIS